MDYHIICDGGGTKADCVLFDREAHILSRAHKPGANALFIGQENAVSSVAQGIGECLDKAGLTLSAIDSIVLFIPGFKACLEPLKARLGFFRIFLQGDEQNAFYGALGTSRGIVVSSGTGSFAMGKNGRGHEYVCGGWGPLIGDYGSGYHMGVLCLSQVARLFDAGRGGSVLERMVLRELGIQTVPALRQVVYAKDFSRERIASLCKTVEQAARAEDSTALAVIQTASDELVALAATIAGHMGEGEWEVALIGGITNMGALITDRFSQGLRRVLPQCRYVASRYKSDIGAVLYVLEHMDGCDIQSPMIIQNISKEV